MSSLEDEIIDTPPYTEQYIEKLSQLDTFRDELYFEDLDLYQDTLKLKSIIEKTGRINARSTDSLISNNYI